MSSVSYDAAYLRLLVTIAIAYAVVAVGLRFSKVSVDFTSLYDIYFALTPFLLADFYARWWKARRISAMLEILIAGVLVIMPITVSTYLAIGVGMPLADDKLAAADSALGFDWRGLIGFVDERPWLAWLLHRSYNSFFVQISLIPIYFAACGNGARACAIVFAYVVLCFLSSLISVWFPALGTYVTYGVGPDDLVNINAKYGFFFLEQFHAVREQADFVLTAGRTAGILTFPSVHAGVAALCAWAAWDSRLLRYPVLLLNVAMAVSAVTDANHYAVDVIAGLGVASVSVGAAKAVFYRRSPAAPAMSPSLAPALAS